MNGISDALKTFTNKFSKTPAVNIKYFITNKYKYSIYESNYNLLYIYQNRILNIDIKFIYIAYSGVKIILLSSPEE